MDTGKLRNQYDETVDPTQPLPVDTVEAQRKLSISETLTYNGKAAAGAVTVNSVAQKAIVSVEGDQVASYWGLEKNKVYTAAVEGYERAGEPRLRTVTETNGSAAVVIVDDNKDLELWFESLTTTVKRYVIRVKDTTGAYLYGWIFGVAKSGNVYTIDVVNNRLTETQNWVGTLASFDNTSLAKAEIFRYSSSLVFGTGTTLTEEVESPREYSKSWQSILNYATEKLTNGQYFVDYMRGRIIGKKADTTASETVTYNILSSTSTSTASTDSTLADDAAFTPTTTQVTPVGFFADETATDSVDEGDIGAARMTLTRKQITASEFQEDTAHVAADYLTVIGTKRTDTAAASAGTDGDYQTLNTDALGLLWTHEYYAPGAEDNSNNVIATAQKPLAVSTYSYSVFTNFGANATLNVKATPGNVFSVKCHNLNAANRYLQLHNTATTPAGAAVPLLTFLIPANSEVTIGNDFFGQQGLNFTTGIAFAFSTTEGTYTAGTATDQFTQVNYK